MSTDKSVVSVEAEKQIAPGASGKAKIVYPVERRGEEIEIFNPSENPSVAGGKLANVTQDDAGKWQVVAAKV